MWYVQIMCGYYSMNSVNGGCFFAKASILFYIKAQGDKMSRLFDKTCLPVFIIQSFSIRLYSKLPCGILN